MIKVKPVVNPPPNKNRKIPRFSTWERRVPSSSASQTLLALFQRLKGIPFSASIQIREHATSGRAGRFHGNAARFWISKRWIREGGGRFRRPLNPSALVPAAALIRLIHQLFPPLEQEPLEHHLSRTGRH